MTKVANTKMSIKNYFNESGTYILMNTILSAGSAERGRSSHYDFYGP